MWPLVNCTQNALRELHDCPQHARRCARNNAAAFCLPVCLTSLSRHCRLSLSWPSPSRRFRSISAWVGPSRHGRGQRNPGRSLGGSSYAIRRNAETDRGALSCVDGQTDPPAFRRWPFVQWKSRGAEPLARSCRRRSRRKHWRPIRWLDSAPSRFHRLRLPVSMEAQSHLNRTFKEQWRNTTVPTEVEA